MAEKPILFSSEMVRAVLDGRKTQTRRVMKPQPVYENDWWWYDDLSFLLDSDMQDYLFHNVYGSKGSPYGSVYGDGTSDTLWVRETWQAQTPAGNWWHEMKGEKELYNWTVIDKATWNGNPPPKWIPSIFMPRWASRITLNVVDVRVERLQDTTQGDVMSEGVPLPDDAMMTKLDPIQPVLFHKQLQREWVKLWDSINLKRGFGWDTNPWVWVVEFEMVTQCDK